MIATKGRVSPGHRPKRRTERLWTFDELAAEVPETNQPMELWDGALIMPPSPSYAHQTTADRFHDLLKAWVRPRRLGRTAIAPLDMVLSPHRATQPDVLFVASARLEILTDRVRGAADLVAEVISPESRRRDRIDKRDLYEQHGIKEYWLIDPEAQTVEVLFLEREGYALVGRWRPGERAKSRLLKGFTVDVTQLFAND